MAIEELQAFFAAKEPPGKIILGQAVPIGDVAKFQESYRL
jgi:hypothetical protein